MKEESKEDPTLGILTKEMLKDKDCDWFYLNTIKETGDPDRWELQNKLFDVDKISDFKCTMVLTEERIKPSWIIHQNKFSKKIVANDQGWYRKALITVSDKNGSDTAIKFVSEYSFDDFIWQH
jgi:hypothetical protein